MKRMHSTARAASPRNTAAARAVPLLRLQQLALAGVVFMFASAAFAADLRVAAPDDPRDEPRPTAVANAPLAVPWHHTYVVSVIAARETGPAQDVDLRVVDLAGDRVDRVVGTVAPGKPMLFKVERNKLDLSGLALLRTKALIGRTSEASCPMMLTAQVVQGNETPGPGFGCGFDPCALNNVSFSGFPSAPGVSVICDGTQTTVTYLP